MSTRFVTLFSITRCLPVISFICLIFSSSSLLGFELQLSTAADRSAPDLLLGSTVQGNIYVFTLPEDNIKKVEFYLDDPGMSGGAIKVEGRAPWDFAGTVTSIPRHAEPFDTTTLLNGSHSIQARITQLDGAVVEISAHFTVANGNTFLFSPSSLLINRSGLTEPYSKSIALEASTGGSIDYTVSDNADWLNVSAQTGQTPDTLLLSIDTAAVTEGRHYARVSVSSTAIPDAHMDIELIAGPDPLQLHIGWKGSPASTLSFLWQTLEPVSQPGLRYKLEGSSTWNTVSSDINSAVVDGQLNQATATGLLAGSRYEYQAKLEGGEWSRSYTTRTAPDQVAADFDFVYVADTGLVGRLDGLATGTEQVIDEIAKINPNLVLLGGDYAYFDTDKRFGSLGKSIDEWFNQMRPIMVNTPVMPTYGNHEVLLGENVDRWIERFPTPLGVEGRRFYSFDIGDVHFVSILAAKESGEIISNEALAWLEQDLLDAKAAGKRWIIPFFHLAPFSEGTNHSSSHQWRQLLGPLFEQAGVKLAISSHDQSFERTYPLTDVPSSNTPTSTALNCYEYSEGVTWIKVSPGGKLSNISGDFSPFSSVTPPLWTAVRDNTQHHFLYVNVKEEGVLEVQTYGVQGDGTTPVVQDQFIYTTASCPGTLSSTPPQLAVNMEPEQVLESSVSIQGPDASAVDFSLKSKPVWASVAPAQSTSPADISVNIDSSGLELGRHSSAIVFESAGLADLIIPISLNISSVSEGEYELRISTFADRRDSESLEGRSLSGNAAIFLNPEEGVSQVRFYLDGAANPSQIENNKPYDFAGTNGLSAILYDTESLVDGHYQILTEVDLITGGTYSFATDFEIDNDLSTSVSFQPGQLDFYATAANAMFQTDVVLQANDGGGVNVSLSSDSSWLVVSPPSGETPENILLDIDTVSLLPGYYQAQVQAAIDGGEEVTLPVNLAIRNYNLADIDVKVSDNNDRLSAVSLDGALVSGIRYIFVNVETTAKRVEFYIDNPVMTGRADQVENNAPYDLAGTNADDTSKPYNTGALSNGLHLLTVKIERLDGSKDITHIQFEVQN